MKRQRRQRPTHGNGALLFQGMILTTALISLVLSRDFLPALKDAGEYYSLLLMSSVLWVRYRAMMIPSPTTASAAAIVMMMKMKICPSVP